MAWTRQLPSGLWASTVRTPAGRITKTHELKSVVADWAADLERDIRHGVFIDPRLAKTTIAEVWDRFAEARRLAKSSRARDASHWKVHVRPRWGHLPVGSVLKPDIQAWVNELDEAGVGANTVIGSLKVLRAVLELAVDAKMLAANPCRKVKPPVIPRHIDRVLTENEEQVLLDRLEDLFGDRPEGRLFVEVLLETGGRYEEVAAVPREAVDLRRKRVTLLPVLERDGTVRPWPKGARPGEQPEPRQVPVSDDLAARLRPLVLRTAPGGLLFTTTTGKPLTYTNWLHRIWHRAIRVPVLDERGRRVKGEDGRPAWEPLLEVPLPTPHDCRHTRATRWADAGLEPHDIMALLGHQDHRSARRYTHSGEKRFDRARKVLEKARKKARKKSDKKGDREAS